MALIDIDFDRGEMAIASFTSQLGTSIQAGQLVKIADTGNVYAVLRDASASEVFSTIIEKTLTASAEDVAGETSVNEQIDEKDEWETSNGKLQPKSGKAPNGVSVNSEATPYQKAFADFTNVGVNLQENSGTYENSITTSGTPYVENQSDANTPYTVTETSINTGDNGGWKMFDGNSGTLWGTLFSFPQSSRIDFGSGVTIGAYQTSGSAVGATYSPKDYTLEGSNNGSDWTLLDTQTGIAGTTGLNTTHTISSPQSFRYYRYSVSAVNGAAQLFQSTLNLFENEYATTSNSGEVNMFTGASSAFAPSSLKITNESDTDITTSGRVNVDYKLNDGSYQGSFIDINTFRALDAAGFADVTQLDLKFQPVDDQRIKDPFIETTSSESLLLAGGEIRALLNAQQVGAMTQSGYKFPDTTVQGTSVENFLSSLPTSDPLVEGEAWNNSGVVTISAG